MTSQNPTPDGTCTPQKGHCEAHCHPWCHGGDKIRDTAPEPFTEQHMSQDRQVWWNRDCPYCEGAKAARERIVAWLLKTDRWVAAEDVARGAHLEANRG